MQIYAIYDRVAESFATPVYFLNDGSAVRAFVETFTRHYLDLNSDQPKEKTPDFILFKENFGFYRLGSFDEVNGTFSGERIELITGVDAARQGREFALKVREDLRASQNSADEAPANYFVPQQQEN